MHSEQGSNSLGSVSVSFDIYGIIHFIIIGKVSFLARQDVHMQMGDRLTSSRAVLQPSCHVMKFGTQFPVQALSLRAVNQPTCRCKPALLNHNCARHIRFEESHGQTDDGSRLSFIHQIQAKLRTTIHHHIKGM